MLIFLQTVLYYFTWVKAPRPLYLMTVGQWPIVQVEPSSVVLYARLLAWFVAAVGVKLSGQQLYSSIVAVTGLILGLHPVNNRQSNAISHWLGANLETALNDLWMGSFQGEVSQLLTILHEVCTWINLLTPGRCNCNIELVVLIHINMIKVRYLEHFPWIALSWMPQDLTDIMSTLVQVMARCRQATSH